MNFDLRCITKRKIKIKVTIQLTDDLEHVVEMKAAQQGLSLPVYILRLIESDMNANFQPKNGAKLVEYWQNERLIGYRTDIADSQSHAREIRNQSSNRLTS